MTEYASEQLNGVTSKVVVKNIMQNYVNNQLTSATVAGRSIAAV